MLAVADAGVFTWRAARYALTTSLPRFLACRKIIKSRENDLREPVQAPDKHAINNNRPGVILSKFTTATTFRVLA